LRELEFGLETFPNFRLEIFNVFERGARFLVSEYTQLDQDLEKTTEPGHILIVGCSRLGESLVLQIARTWYETWKKVGKKLDLTVIDPRAEIRIARLTAMYPDLSECCRLTPLNLDLDDPGLQKGDFLFDTAGKCVFSNFFICLEAANKGLIAALNLRLRLGSNQPPIILYMEEESGIIKLLSDKEKNNKQNRNIIPFNLIQSTCIPDLVINGTHEILARSVHADYLRKRLSEGVQMGAKRSMALWDELPEDLRESNRRQVDHMQLKLQQIGYGIEPLRNWDASGFQFTPEEVEQMARMEHDHWMEERFKAGWTYAPAPEDPENKTHPDLRSWDQIDETTREKDRQTVYALPKTLARAGFQVYKMKEH
jgi:hypothetical protein